MKPGCRNRDLNSLGDTRLVRYFHAYRKKTAGSSAIGLAEEEVGSWDV